MAIWMTQGKQAKIFSRKQEAAVLRHLDGSRYPRRDRAMFLLSVKAGLRAKEIAALPTCPESSSASGANDPARRHSKNYAFPSWGA